MGQVEWHSGAMESPSGWLAAFAAAVLALLLASLGALFLVTFRGGEEKAKREEGEEEVAAEGSGGRGTRVRKITAC